MSNHSPFNKTTYNKEYHKIYYKKNRNKILEYTRKWQQLNKNRVSLNTKKYSVRLRGEIMEKLGKKCKECGFSDIRALQIDHVNGGGKKHRSERKNYYRSILNSLEKKENSFQLLCANCNWIKKYEKDETYRLYRD